MKLYVINTTAPSSLFSEAATMADVVLSIDSVTGQVTVLKNRHGESGQEFEGIASPGFMAWWEAQTRDLMPWAVWWVNDCDWWLARSGVEAMEDYRSYDGSMADEAMTEGYPRPATDGEMDNLKYDDGEEGEVPLTFREELNRRLAKGPRVEMFASTEF